MVEVWLRGPVKNVPEMLQPVVHALLQAREEINELMLNFDDKKLWQKPAGVASAGFHLQHIAGVLDRLFTYAKNLKLDDAQLKYLSLEGVEDDALTSAALVAKLNNQIDLTVASIVQTDEATLTQPRAVGRQQLPSTVLGLMFHSAEHTMRHVGQLFVTVKVLS